MEVMAATIYWRSDESNDSEIKSVNVPGVFPRPSNKLNSKAIFAEAKPWLQSKNLNVKSRKGTRELRPTEKAPSKIQNTLKDRSTIDLQVKDSKTMEENRSLSASLKDLRNEDKRKITNLIKELAKAGEERKIAVGALHKERSTFEEKQKELKLQQEKIISERDELREKLQEYQFLVNQFSKQLEKEKEVARDEQLSKEKEIGVLEVSKVSEPEMHHPEIQEQSQPIRRKDMSGAVNGDSNTPCLQNITQDLKTYYHVPHSHSKSHQETVIQCYRIDKGGPDQNSSEFHGQVDQKINDSPKISQVSNINQLSDRKESSRKKESGINYQQSMDGLNCDAREDSLLSISASLQNALLEQQNKLLEQQTQIQEQIEQLKIMQKSSNIELLKALKPIDDLVSVSHKTDEQTAAVADEGIEFRNPDIEQQKCEENQKLRSDPGDVRSNRISPSGHGEQNTDISRQFLKKTPSPVPLRHKDYSLYDKKNSNYHFQETERPHVHSASRKNHKDSITFGQSLEIYGEQSSNIKSFENERRNQFFEPEALRGPRSTSHHSWQSQNGSSSKSVRLVAGSQWEEDNQYPIKSSMKKSKSLLTPERRQRGKNWDWEEERKQSSLLDVLDVIDDEMLDEEQPYQSSFLGPERHAVKQHFSKFRDVCFSEIGDSEHEIEIDDSKVLSDIFYL